MTRGLVDLTIFASIHFELVKIGDDELLSVAESVNEMRRDVCLAESVNEMRRRDDDLLSVGNELLSLA